MVSSEKQPPRADAESARSTSEQIDDVEFRRIFAAIIRQHAHVFEELARRDEEQMGKDEKGKKNGS